MTEVTLNYERIDGDLQQFWRSTGFTPAKLLLDPDMRQALAYVGSVPNGGIEYVRVHYLLNLVRATDLHTDDPTYDWTDLDRGLDVLVENDLRPFFELMGYPGATGTVDPNDPSMGYFDDFNDDEQVHAWKQFVRDLAEHLIDRYEIAEVRQWYFETWNEPDLLGWDRFGFAREHEAFCNYYDACSKGLLEADENLRMGGPGTARTLSPLLKSFVEHCDSGENYFTGEDVRLDFLSVHEKGASPNEEDVTPDTEMIVENELAAYEYVQTNHPGLADRPMMNNECDPHTGWTDTHTWRAKPYYAALAAKVIDQHVDRIVDDTGFDYDLLSNDNGFIGAWGQRTHLARFGEGGFGAVSLDPNRAKERERVDAFDFVKKPVHNLMTALSLLGDERLTAVYSEDALEDIHVLPTRRDSADQVAILVSHARDEIEARDERPVTLHLKGLPTQEVAFTQYRIDEDHGNPYETWEAVGAPAEPSPEQLRELRREQELNVKGETKIQTLEDGDLHLDFDLPLPGVSLVLVSGKPDDPPGTVRDVRTESYRGMNTVGDQTLVLWDDLPERDVRTYEVLRADDPDGPFERVNEVDLISTAFLDTEIAPDEEVRYAVRAVDYWDRRGERSETVQG